MKWYYPSLSGCPWAQEILAERDRRLHDQHVRWFRWRIIPIWAYDLDNTFIEDCLVKYTETGDNAWLKVAADHRTKT